MEWLRNMCCLFMRANEACLSCRLVGESDEGERSRDFLANCLLRRHCRRRDSNCSYSCNATYADGILVCVRACVRACDLCRAYSALIRASLRLHKSVADGKLAKIA